VCVRGAGDGETVGGMREAAVRADEMSARMKLTLPSNGYLNQTAPSKNPLPPQPGKMAGKCMHGQVGANFEVSIDIQPTDKVKKPLPTISVASHKRDGPRTLSMILKLEGGQNPLGNRCDNRFL
jgi:hypothetical protein